MPEYHIRIPGISPYGHWTPGGYRYRLSLTSPEMYTLAYLFRLEEVEGKPALLSCLMAYLAANQ